MKGRPPEDVGERLERNSMPEPNSGCHIWIAGIDKDGYGMSSVKARPIMAHRLSWIYTYGEIPPATMVLHRCDNPPCINPDHLFLGNKKTNAEDMTKKGRGRVGVRNGSAKLTLSQVYEIRAAVGSQEKIAKQFGIKQTAVSAIKIGRTWRGL